LGIRSVAVLPVQFLVTNADFPSLGYEVYDRFSKPYQKLFDSLTATYVGDDFLKAAATGKATLYDKPRGSPHNVGKSLSTVHPLVRTNPVTGWKRYLAIPL
jgi:hypothetical protein